MDSSVASHIHTALEHGRLPWPVLLVLVLGMFGTIAFAIVKFTEVLKILNGPPPFPTHATATCVGLIVFLGMATIAMCRAALGMEWPDGYDFVWGSIVSVVFGVAAWGVGKRATSAEREQAKTTAALAMAAAAPTNGAAVTVQGDATISATAERPVPTPNPAVVLGLEALAKKQTARAGVPMGSRD